MRLGSAHDLLLPKSLKMRIFAVCFIGTHVPLLSFVATQLMAGRVAWGDVLILLIATLVGSIGALYAIHAMLDPLRLSIDGLESIGRGEPVSLTPITGPSEISELLRRVNEAAASVHSRLNTLDQAANRDTLTGLLNRRGFFSKADPLFRTHIGGAFAVIDLDRFKEVNDRFGHPVGDQVLRDFAGRLLTTGARDSIMARWGGEEFVVYFPRMDESTAQSTLEDLLLSLENAPLGPPGLPAVTFSAGLVEAGHESIEQTAERADTALYAAKRAGRAQIFVERDLVSRASD